MITPVGGGGRAADHGASCWSSGRFPTVFVGASSAKTIIGGGPQIRLILTLKKFAARLPLRWQQELKRRYFARQIHRRTFRTNEPEYYLLPSMVGLGDWVLDIGANVGHYMMRLSELVGEQGRVICFEPVPETFEMLAANAALAPFRNISLINAAASDRAGLSGMTIPKFADTGLDNFYTAQLSDDRQIAMFQVLCIAVDSLALPHGIRLVKVDVEGHELSVVRGMKSLLVRDHPTLILEDNDPAVVPWLEALGYSSEKLGGSSNRVFRFT